jgi:hypothetical protein
MDDFTVLFDGEAAPKARLALLLEHFSELSDDREPDRIMYRLDEVLLLVTCATISSCDDFDEIAAWGQHHLGFLRRFSEFHFGVPCERWLRTLVNRVDPILFGRCFESWIAALWPDRHDLIAIDGKTARRTHDRRKGLKPLHTLSAYATNARLTLAQLSVPEKTMSGRRPLSRDFLRLCECLGCGHVYGLFCRKDRPAGPDVSSAAALRPITNSR